MTDEGKDDVVELRQKYERERERSMRFEGKLTDLEKQLKAFEGIDLEKLKADSDALQNVMRDKAKNSGDSADVEALESRLRQDYQAQIDTLQKERDTYQSKFREVSIVDGVFTKLAGKFNDDTHPFIKDLIRTQVDIDEDKFIIKDKEGKPRYSRTQPSQLMGLDEFQTELEEKYPSFVRPSVPAGTKERSGKVMGGTGSIDVSKYLSMTPEQRAEIPRVERLKLAQQAVKH